MSRRSPNQNVCLGLGLLLLAGTSFAAAETYVWRNVAIGGGGFVTGVEFHPRERGLAYARTDVGGAYRWDAAANRWIPLLDWLGPADWNLHGIESLALDPTDSNRIYLAAGTYTWPDASHGEILRSTDRGTTWERTVLPFKLGANEAGRGSGERLVVDPNSPNLLYLGTRRDGLWRSTDHGKTWARVPGFPDVPDDSVKYPLQLGTRFNYLAQAVGIVWVRIAATSGRPGEPTPVLYAGISRTGESIFHSTDAGKTWAPLPGQPTAFRPTGAALAADGTLYVSYADEPGPNRMGDGAVWKFTPQTDSWKEITPETPKPTPEARGFGYATVSLAPGNPGTVLATTWNRYTPFDEIFHSDDGGQTWRPLLANATWDHSPAPYTRTMRHHWLSDVEIDPANPECIVFNTGYGLWASTNAASVTAGQPINWRFHNDGLEETVPLALISPPEGAHLISGLGDIDGFVHDNFNLSPADGRFPAPGYKNTEWLDYAALQPGTILRSGTTYGHDRVHAAISYDGARTWTALPSEPPHPHDSRRFTTGPAAISADGRTITWTPRNGRPYFSDDRGRTWRETTLPANVRVIGDRVDPDVFYGYDPAQGVLHVSTDRGLHFNAEQTDLPIVPSMPWGNNHGDLAAVPGRAGECWLAAGGRLFHFTAKGAKVTALAQFTNVGAVGFGRAAPGTDYPAIFAAGTREGVNGIHRSDDGGSTWVCITDPRHQFGSMSRLTGDPRVFGRVYFCTGGRGIVYGERVVYPGK